MNFESNESIVNKFIEGLVFDDDYEFLLKSFVSSAVNSRTIFEGKMRISHDRYSLRILRCAKESLMKMTFDDKKKEEFVKCLVENDIINGIDILSNDLECIKECVE